MMVKRNCGKPDRIVRLVLAAFFLPASLFLLDGWLATVLLLLGFLLLMTGATGFCVLYVPFGISTAKKKRSSDLDPRIGPRHASG